jgi:hypothetical protein
LAANEIHLVSGRSGARGEGSSLIAESDDKRLGFVHTIYTIERGEIVESAGGPSATHDTARRT